MSPEKKADADTATPQGHEACAKPETMGTPPKPEGIAGPPPSEQGAGQKKQRKNISCEQDALGRFWDTEETEFLCPKCSKPLLLRRQSSGARSSLIGGYFIAAQSMARAKLKCPEHGVIADDELRTEDREAFKKEKSEAMGCALGIVAIIAVITLIIIVAMSAR
jgi:hypothetical protein